MSASRRPARIILAALAAVPLAASAAAIPGTAVVLQGLNKVTARISTFSAPIGAAVRFGGLEITAHYCEKARPEETPEVAAFLDVRDRGPAARQENLFSGWMFASSPGVSALEHPIYDLWVLDCTGVTPPAVTPPPPRPASPPRRG